MQRKWRRILQTLDVNRCDKTSAGLKSTQRESENISQSGTECGRDARCCLTGRYNQGVKAPLSGSDIDVFIVVRKGGGFNVSLG